MTSSPLWPLLPVSPISPPARTQVHYETFVCQSPSSPHEFRCAVRTRDREIGYKPVGADTYLPVPKCPEPDCDFLGVESSLAGSAGFAQVPEGERFVAFLSADGERLAVPGKTSGPGFEQSAARRRALGYVRVEARSLADMDALDAIRARQTGNEVYNEMNYSQETRKIRAEADYSDDPTTDV